MTDAAAASSAALGATVGVRPMLIATAVLIVGVGLAAPGLIGPTGGPRRSPADREGREPSSAVPPIRRVPPGGTWAGVAGPRAAVQVVRACRVGRLAGLGTPWRAR
jgi:hypothetical protein